jgi:hypothetical protein
MLATPHILTGAVIGILLSSIPAIIIIVFLSHFVLDTIPHTEVSTFRSIEERNDPHSVKSIDYIVAAIDIILGIGIAIYLLVRQENFFLPMIGIFFAEIIDIDNLPWWQYHISCLPIAKQLSHFHSWIHFDLKTKYWPVGIITQLIIIGVAIWVLLK